MTIRENLIEAIREVTAFPEERLSLEKYVTPAKNECGTLYCAAGLLATKPFFNAQGMVLKMAHSECGSAMYQYVTHESACCGNHDRYWATMLFGESGFSNVFATFGAGTWDHFLIRLTNRRLSDKELVLLRLQEQLKFYPESSPDLCFVQSEV